jgi:uncharacterized protein (DUF169 family)
MSQDRLTELLWLDAAPVAIAFVDTAPAGVQRVGRAEPARCGYWRRAAAGEVFFTIADDHKQCQVGAHTHNVPLTAAEQNELMGLVKDMVDLSYLRMEEVPRIPRRAAAFQVAVYSPLACAPLPPDVVLVRGNARQLMLLAEAADHAGVSLDTPAMGRPTCAVVPEAINSKHPAISFGCVGNRVYTGAGDGDAYMAIPGPALPALENSLAVIVRANEALLAFHQNRSRPSDPVEV